MDDEKVEDDIFAESLNVDDNGAQRMFDCPCPVPNCDGTGDTLYHLTVPHESSLLLPSAARSVARGTMK